MGKTAVAIDLTAIERRELESLASRRKTAQGLAQRARIVLLAAEGAENRDIGLRVNAAPNTVGKWRRRFAERRIDGLLDEPRPGAPRQIGDDDVAEVIRQTLETTPRGATHWSLRSMARAAGFAPSTIHRIWKAFNLQPHRTETFKLSADPLFVEKVRDIVGLYLSPPERAVVLCVDEKSQIQALDRTQPLLPMRPGQVERRTHDYTRHGTLSLFAALDAAAGTVIGRCYPRHRGREFLRFLREIERNVPPDLNVHLVMDNYATHRQSRSENGWARGRDGMFTSRRLPVPGSIRSSASSPTSPKSKSAAASTARRRNWKPRSEPTSTPSTPILSPSAGPKTPTTFSPPISASVSRPSTSLQPKPKSPQLQNQDTRAR